MATELPTTTRAFSTSATEADFKTFLSSQRDFLAGLLGTDGLVETARNSLGVSDLTLETIVDALGYTPLQNTISGITTALGYSPIGAGANSINSIVFAYNFTGSPGIFPTFGFTYAASGSIAGTWACGLSITGSWLCISSSLIAGTGCGLFRKIA